MNKAFKKCTAMILACCTAMSIQMSVWASDEQASVDDSYFNDTVFVGDSISYKLKLYVETAREKNPGFFGNAQFLAQGGLGSINAQLPVSGNSFHPRYQGEKMRLEDSVAATGAEKMYIMFGMNDLASGVDEALESLDSLLDKILAQSPNLKVVVQSVTPIVTDREQAVLNNANIREYNDALESLCGRRGFEYLDIGRQLADDDGGLIPSYCGDASSMGMHLSDEACNRWVAFLRENAGIGEDAAEEEPDTQTPPEDETEDTVNKPAQDDTSGEEPETSSKPEGETSTKPEEETSSDPEGETSSKPEKEPSSDSTESESADDTSSADDTMGKANTARIPESTQTSAPGPVSSATMTSEKNTWYAGLETDESLKTYALDAAGATPLPKPWHPKLKGRALNPPA